MRAPSQRNSGRVPLPAAILTADASVQGTRRPAQWIRLEETMDPIMIGAGIVLVVFLAIFTAIAFLGLVGPSRRW